MKKPVTPDFNIQVNHHVLAYDDIAALGEHEMRAERHHENIKATFHENAAMISGSVFIGASVLLFNMDLEPLQMAFASCANLVCGAYMGLHIFRHRRHDKNARELDQAVVLLAEDADQATYDETKEILVNKGVFQRTLCPNKIIYEPVIRYQV